MAVQVLIRLQRTHRRVKPDESSAFMCHFLHHQYIITQQGTRMEWSLDWGQDSLGPAQAQTPVLWFSPAEDFTSPFLCTNSLMLNQAWSSRSLPPLQALSVFLSDSGMPVFVELNGTWYFMTPTALSNQGEIGQQVHMLRPRPQVHRDCRKSSKNYTHR